MNQDSIWRDESTGLPIHMHGHPIKLSEVPNVVGQMGNPIACNCGNSFWDISKSAGELVRKHEAVKELSEVEYKRLRYCEWISEDQTT